VFLKCPNTLTIHPAILIHKLLIIVDCEYIIKRLLKYTCRTGLS